MARNDVASLALYVLNDRQHINRKAVGIRLVGGDAAALCFFWAVNP